jgi:hypothetical protein
MSKHLSFFRTMYNPDPDPALPAYPQTDFQYYQPPNPTWSYGEPVEATAEGRKWMEGLKAGSTTFTIGQEDPLYAACHPSSITT